MRLTVSSIALLKGVLKFSNVVLVVVIWNGPNFSGRFSIPGVIFISFSPIFKDTPIEIQNVSDIAISSKSIIEALFKK